MTESCEETLRLADEIGRLRRRSPLLAAGTHVEHRPTGTPSIRELVSTIEEQASRSSWASQPARRRLTFEESSLRLMRLQVAIGIPAAVVAILTVILWAHLHP